MATEKPILNFVVEEDLLKRLDDFRFKNRFSTRSDAVRWLLEAGLKAGLKPEKE